MHLSDQTNQESHPFTRRYDYENTTVFAIDLSMHKSVDVDIVDSTAILVYETATGTEQHEFELPDGEPTAFNNNGLITIEVTK